MLTMGFEDLVILIASAFMKIPQMMRIHEGTSTEGLSFAMFWIEAVGYSITTAYSIRKDQKFETFGEHVFLYIGNVIIMIMFIWVVVKRRPTSPERSHLSAYIILNVVFFLSMLIKGLFNVMILDFFQFFFVPLIAILSRLPQVILNWTHGGTGKLDWFMCLMSLIGNSIRIHTTIVENNSDPYLLAGYGTGFVMNFILLGQIAHYKGLFYQPWYNLLGYKRGFVNLTVELDEPMEIRATSTTSTHVDVINV